MTEITCFHEKLFRFKVNPFCQFPRNTLYDPSSRIQGDNIISSPAVIFILLLTNEEAVLY